MRFTDAQREAIEHRGGHLQILACAGTGKTEVLARRIAALLDPSREDALEPRNVVAFTFTDRGAAELKARIVRRVHETRGPVHGLAEMFVGTIHAFCGRLLQDEDPEYLHVEVLDETRQRMLVLREPDASGFSLARTAEGAPLVAPGDVRRYLGALDVLRQAEVDHAHLGDAPLAVALDRYRALLRREGLLDYTGQLEHALDLLRRNIDAGTRLAARVRHVVVDEYQDTNALQEELLRALVEVGATLTVVGDDDQTIFQWNGADVRNILTFAERYEGVHQVRLEENFRSSAPIVSFAGRFIEGLDARLPKSMQSTDAQPFEVGDVAALGFANEWDEARFIARKILALRGTEIREGATARGLSWSDMAVLYRGNIRWAATCLRTVFDEMQIPYVVTGVKTLFERAEVQAVVTLFGVLAGATEVDRATLRSRWAAAGLARNDRLDALDVWLDGLCETLRGECARARWPSLGLGRLLLDALDLAGTREACASAAREGALFNLGRFSQVVADFEALHAQRPPRARIEAFWAYVSTAAAGEHEEGVPSSEFASPDAVQITTVHRAKGLQWPAVFLPSLGEGRFPPVARATSLWELVPRAAVRDPSRYESRDDDERRLFYVAVTRAQRYLFATWAPGRTRKPTRPGPYWEALARHPQVVTRDTPLRGRTHTTPSPRAGTSALRLTFSVLKPMLTCPYRFKLEGIFGFAAPLEESQGVGRGLHDALAEVHRRAIEGDAVDVSLVPRLVARHLHLPYASDDTVARMRAVMASILTRYLVERGPRLAEVMLAEKAVEVVMPDDVLVHGRIDLVVRREGTVTVVDLKSTHRAQAEALTDVQLGLYALGYEALTGALPARTETWELDTLDTHGEAVDGARVVRLRALVDEVATRMRRGDLPPAPDPDRCATCTVRAVCGHRAETVSHET